MAEPTAVMAEGRSTDPPAPWYGLEQQEVLSRLEASADGLSTEQARRRLERHGPNRLNTEEREPLLAKIGEALLEPLQLLLIAVGVLSAVFGELRDAIAIFAIIAAVAGIEIVTELRARRALTALRALAAPRARVHRDGSLIEVAVDELVPGDVVSLEAGDVVPADCRILDSSALAVNESALTGESEAAAKSAAPVQADAPLAERSSLVFAGTRVVSGEGLGVVVATGAETELGRLGRMVAEEREPPTPLERAMSELARTVLLAAIAASVIVPLVGLLRGQPFTQMLLAGLTLAFATIPEELPILVSVLLAVGGRRLARRHALLRRLRAGETIGAVTAIVTDKTGTLTENRLELREISGPRDQVLEVAAATHSLRRGGSIGDPLELALAAATPPSIKITGDLIASFPFDPQRKRMSRIWQTGAGIIVYAKGAPESIIARCALSEAERVNALASAEKLAARGLRVLAFAKRPVDAPPVDAAEAENNLELVGLAAFEDPLRAGVTEAVAALRQAGVKTIVVTGDHPETARAIALQAGLDQGELLHGGNELAALSDAELSERLQDSTVVARATPADKLRIVRILQARGEVVGVTGDGINDAPALAAADVGIAMGRRGTDLAREAADLILTDDAYPTIAGAVEGGRALASQLRRAVAFYLGAKVALVAAMLVPLALGMRAPFTPVQIVLLELFMDLGASVAFVAEPTAPNTMRRPPRDPARRFLDRTEAGSIALIGAVLFTGVLASFLIVRARYGDEYGGVAAFASWLIGHTGVAWTLRARPRLSLRANPAFPLWAAAAAIAAVILTASGLAGQLGFPTLPVGSWALVIAASALTAGLAVAARLATHFTDDF